MGGNGSTPFVRGAVPDTTAAEGTDGADVDEMGPAPTRDLARAMGSGAGSPVTEGKPPRPTGAAGAAHAGSAMKTGIAEAQGSPMPEYWPTTNKPVAAADGQAAGAGAGAGAGVAAGAEVVVVDMTADGPDDAPPAAAATAAAAAGTRKAAPAAAKPSAKRGRPAKAKAAAAIAATAGDDGNVVADGAQGPIEGEGEGAEAGEAAEGGEAPAKKARTSKAPKAPKAPKPAKTPATSSSSSASSSEPSSADGDAAPGAGADAAAAGEASEPSSEPSKGARGKRKASVGAALATSAVAKAEADEQALAAYPEVAKRVQCNKDRMEAAAAELTALETCVGR